MHTLIEGPYRADVKKFTPIAEMCHTVPISLPGIEIWEEQIKADNLRNYALSAHPASPPSSALFSKIVPAKTGISIMALNSNQTILATKSDSAPTTAWIWSMKTTKPVTVLIHHSPIKQLAWHPSQHDLILIHCVIPEPTIHVWKANWDSPKALTLPLESTTGKLEASWLQCNEDEKYNVLLCSQTSSVIAQISADGDLVPFIPQTVEESAFNEAGPEDMFDEGNSLDLSPIKF